MGGLARTGKAAVATMPKGLGGTGKVGGMGRGDKKGVIETHLQVTSLKAGGRGTIAQLEGKVHDQRIGRFYFKPLDFEVPPEARVTVGEPVNVKIHLTLVGRSKVHIDSVTVMWDVTEPCH